MAGTAGAAPAYVELARALEEAPYKFDFFQAMRLIEAAHPGSARLGESLRPGNDPIRLGQEPSMAFAPAMLAQFRPGQSGKTDYLAAFFFGLFGPNGPLPLHLSEYARERERLSQPDATFRAFADVFHHRLLSLFYRAWADAQPTVAMDRPETDPFARYVGSTFGIGLDSCRNRDALFDHAKLYMAGRLGLQTRPADGLQAMLEELFQVPMQVEQYVGEWMDLPQESHLVLGESPDTGTLGLTTTLGARVWGGQHKFRIRCGPVDARDFSRFLPSGESLDKLSATVRNYIGDELDFELNILVAADAVPSVELGRSGQLGWTSWLGTRPDRSAADEVVLRSFDWSARRAS